MPRVPFQITAGELAGRFGLELSGGDPALAIEGVGTLSGAGPAQLSFLANPQYRAQRAQSSAGLVVMRAADAEGHAGAALVAADPYVAYARIAALFDRAPAADAGIHPSAVIDATAEVDPGAAVGPFVAIGAGSRVAAGARLGPGCVVGEDCEVGAGSVLVARADGAGDISIGGSGDVTVREGRMNDLSVAIGGSGDVRFGGTTRDLSVAIAGSGDVSVGAATGQVSPTVVGSGTVNIGR